MHTLKIINAKKRTINSTQKASLQHVQQNQHRTAQKTRHYLFTQLTYLQTNCKFKLRLILYLNLKHERL
jgi:hypothetical protein